MEENPTAIVLLAKRKQNLAWMAHTLQDWLLFRLIFKEIASGSMRKFEGGKERWAVQAQAGLFASKTFD
jgi:hypothetical protein